MKKYLIALFVFVSFNCFASTIVNPYMQGYWKFEQNALDSSGKAMTLTASGSPTYTTLSAADSYAFIKIQSNYFTIPAGVQAAITTSAVGWSYSARYYPTSNTDLSGYLYAPSLKQDIDSSNNWITSISGLFTPYTYASEKNTWINIGMTYNKITKEFNLYKNNILINRTWSTLDPLASTGTWYLGVSTVWGIGLIDDVCLTTSIETQFPIPLFLTNTPTVTPTNTEIATCPPVQTNTPIPTSTPGGNCLDMQYVSYGYPAITTTSKGVYVPLTGTSEGYVDFYSSVTYSGVNIYASIVTSMGASTTTTAYYQIVVVSPNGITWTSQGRPKYLNYGGADEATLGGMLYAPITSTGKSRIYFQCMSDNGVPIRSNDIAISAVPLTTYDGADSYPLYEVVSPAGVTSTGATAVTVSTKTFTSTYESHYLIGFSSTTVMVGGQTTPRSSTFGIYIDGQLLSTPMINWLTDTSDNGNPKLILLSTHLEPGTHTITAYMTCSETLTARQIMSYNNRLNIMGLTSQNGIEIQAQQTQHLAEHTVAAKVYTKIIDSAVDMLSIASNKIFMMFSGNIHTTSATTTTAKVIGEIDGNTITGSAERFIYNSSDYGSIFGVGRTPNNVEAGRYTSGYISMQSDNGVPVTLSNHTTILLAGCGAPFLTNTVTPTNTGTITKTTTQTATQTITPSTTATATPTITPTKTITQTITQTMIATQTITPTPYPTATYTTTPLPAYVIPIPTTAIGNFCVKWNNETDAVGYALLFNNNYKIEMLAETSSDITVYAIDLTTIPNRNLISSVQVYAEKADSNSADWYLSGPLGIAQVICQ